MDVIGEIVDAFLTAVLGTREETQMDYALCGPSK